MINKLLIASAGFFAGASYIVVQILNGRIVVKQDADGNIKIRSKGSDSPDIHGL